MDRYETNSKGTSPALSALINQFANMPRSAFDETRRKSLDAAPYAIIPIETFLMFPNSQAYLNYDVTAITKNPTIKRMLSGMSVELRTYKCKCSDLWEGWNNFITRGRSGKLNLQIPNVNFIHNGKYTTVPFNPAHYLNIAPATHYAKNQSFEDNQGFLDPTDTTKNDVTGLQGLSFDLSASSAYKDGINALPFVMYAKIGKEYQNSNLLQNNPNWYPENENHDLILPYNATTVSNASYDAPTVKFGDTVTLPDGTTATANEVQPEATGKSYPWLNVLYYRQRKGNYFNTGSPFPDLLRGDIPTLNVISANINFDNALATIPNNTLYGKLLGLDSNNKLFSTGRIQNSNTGFDTTSDSVNAINLIENSNYWTNTDRAKLLETLNNATISGINFSMNQWRRLATLTVFRERMARTDGSYNQMIQAQFQHNPNWHEHSVTYCGGSSQPIVFSEVVQQSADASSPLGTTAGRAVTSSYNNQITINADDFTIFMTVMTITPDDYYSQGLDRMWTELTQSEQYFPILNNLEPQAILNKELFLTGTDSDDNDVFNYQELFSHFKSRQNQVSGLMALPISKVGDTGAYIFNRILSAKPEFNNAFVTGKFTDNENLAFASTEQAQFAFSIVSQMKYVAPIPAVTQPSDMGISY
ncbi:MAG: hypothetical protein K6E74_02070 [Bacilli bacterium]|nr:hypothetical protein [Bacilli bacterium]